MYSSDLVLQEAARATAGANIAFYMEDHAAAYMRLGPSQALTSHKQLCCLSCHSDSRGSKAPCSRARASLQAFHGYTVMA